jgi:hypothetical protein
MIQLNPECLIFETPAGEHIPCSAEVATLQLMGDSAPGVDFEVVQNASAAVLHYFKHELNQESVSVGDFAQALQKVFLNLGVKMPVEAPALEPRAADSDLERLARDASDGLELVFYAALRAELRRLLAGAPGVVRFRGLRECAMRLTGSARWNRRCQGLSDQIVAYLRTCWSVEAPPRPCALVIH